MSNVYSKKNEIDRSKSISCIHHPSWLYLFTKESEKTTSTIFMSMTQFIIFWRIVLSKKKMLMFDFRSKNVGK